MKPQLTSPDVAVIPVLFQVPWMNCWAWTWLDLMMFYQELLMMWKTLISLHIICTGDTSMIHQSFWLSSEVMTKLVITWDTIGDNNSNDNINIVLLFFDFSSWFQLFCSEDHIFVSCTQLSQPLRAVTKGRGPGIFPGYYKSEPRLLWYKTKILEREKCIKFQNYELNNKPIVY